MFFIAKHRYTEQCGNNWLQCILWLFLIAKHDIPNSIKKIGDKVFEGCSSLKNLYIRSENIEKVEINCTESFNDEILNNCIMHIPSGTRWTYKHHPIFGKFKNIVTEKFD